MTPAIPRLLALLTVAVMAAPARAQKPGQDPGQGPAKQCREYQSTASVEGQPQAVVGTACRQPDGAWKIMNQGSEQDRARDAVSAGRALPLADIMTRVRRRYPGRLLDARLQPGGNYRLKMITPESRVLWLDVDASSGKVSGVREGGPDGQHGHRGK